MLCFDIFSIAIVSLLAYALASNSYLYAGVALLIAMWRLRQGDLLGSSDGKGADKISFSRFKDPGAVSYAVTYSNPRPFKSFLMTFDPSTVQYDWYQVQVTYRNYRNPSLPATKRYYDKGVPMTNDPSKRVLVIGGNNLDYSSKPYPSSDKSNYIQFITVQFFLQRPASAEKLAAFDNIRKQAEFHAIGGVTRSSPRLEKTKGWNVSTDLATWLSA
jgi:hypothetical protein